MSSAAVVHPLPAYAFAKATLVLALWITLGVFLALAAPKAADIQTPLAGTPATPGSATPPSPI